MRALLLAADDAVRPLVAPVLDRHGYALQEATTGDAVVAAARTALFDLVLLEADLVTDAVREAFTVDSHRHRGGIPLLFRRAEGEVLVLEPMTGPACINFHTSVELACQLGIANRSRENLSIEQQRSAAQLSAVQSQLHDRNQALRDLTVRDTLTGLYHHAHFQTCLDQEIARSGRHGHSFGLILLDVDHFKQICDVYGHMAGDTLLKQLGGIIVGQPRSSDVSFVLRPADTAARFGGDEFAIILPETSKGGVEVLAERLREAVAGSRFGAARVHATVSIGVVSYPEDALSRDGLVNASRVSLARAKALGRNRIVAYTKNMVSADAAVPGLTLERRLNALDSCIEHSRFGFAYQPIVRSGSMEVFGYEALCRPHHSEFRTPDILIRTAEEAGKTWQLGRALRRRAMEPVSDLPGDALMFINVHPHEVEDPEFLKIEEYLRPWADRIAFEITERSAIRDYSRFVAALQTLRDNGFRIVIDDLGSGYASLNSLVIVEPDFVKIDMSLIRGIEHNERKALLIRKLLEFAASVGIEVIAEGIETEAERITVQDLGCRLMQGFLFGRPSEPFMAVVRPDALD